MYWFDPAEARRDWNDRETRSHRRWISCARWPTDTKKSPDGKALRRTSMPSWRVSPWGLGSPSISLCSQWRIHTGQARPRLGQHHVPQSRTWVPSISCARDDNAISQAELMDGISRSRPHGPGCLGCAPCLQVPAHARKATCAFEIGPPGRTHLLKKNPRIEALMFVYFLAQLVCALIERQLRSHAPTRSIPHPDPPEDRPSRPDHRATLVSIALDISPPKMASSWRPPTREPTKSRKRGGKREGEREEDYMRDWLTIPLFLVAYVVLTQWLLPKLGVPT